VPPHAQSPPNFHHSNKRQVRVADNLGIEAKDQLCTCALVHWLRDECLNASWFGNLFEARRKVAAWQEEYNEERPHSSLGYRTPAAFAASLREMPSGGGLLPSIRREVYMILRNEEERHGEREA